ncbi:cation channel sperm-associated auxiliary subunit zeta [Saccopteryx leptura]|uniref:cation channel sperm-associated auxiliary subunit zeta n=1 Tax=Saccopteryx leptura TaxID=249018 RepID=UPI00339C0EC0
MEEKPFKAPSKASDRHDSVRLSLNSDIRNLLTPATLSQSTLNAQLTNVNEDSEQEGSSRGSKPGQWYTQKTSHDSDTVWEEWDDGNGKVSLKQEDLEVDPDSFSGSHVEGDQNSRTKMGYRSEIGKNHFLTKQLQRYIEGLKRRRNKSQHVSGQ